MDVLRLYRDDGPLVDLLAAGAGRLALPAVPLTLLGALVLLVGLALDGADTGLWTLVGVAGFVLLCTAARLGRPHERIQWLVPPTLRAAEYGLVLTLAWRADARTITVAYALLAALAYHHYDIVYRLRHQRTPPPDWVRRLGGGWEVRVLAVTAGAALGVTPVAIGVVAAWCGALFGAESLVSWISVAGDERRTIATAIEEDDELEDAHEEVG